MNLSIIAIIQAKPEYSTEVAATLQHMVQETRKEDACLQYDLHRDLTDPHTFVFYERWSDQQGLDTHNQQPYIQDFGQLIKEKLQQQPQLYITHKI